MKHQNPKLDPNQTMDQYESSSIENATPKATNPNDPPPIPDNVQEKIIACVEDATNVVQQFTPNVPISQVARR